MFSSKATQNMAFVSRQLSGLMKDHSLDESLSRLSEASPDEYKADVAYLESLLQEKDDAKPTLGPNPYDAIAKLLPSVSDARDTLFLEFEQYIQQSKIVFQTYWAGIIGLTWYLAAVSGVALSIGLLFSELLMPSLSEMTSSFGAEMPGYTRALFDFADTGMPTFAVVLLGSVAVVVFFVTQFHRRIQQMAPLPRWPRWAPVIGRVAETYNLGLFLNYTNILRRSGLAAREAVSVAANATNQSADLTLDALENSADVHQQSRSLAELGIAARLGTLDSELTHQCEQHVGQLTVVLVEARDRFSLVLKIALYVFVAALVIAMYLPIFQMGSVV